MLGAVRIVLVRPIRPGNVGAVCRAMKNMGLRELVLVAPQCDLTHPDAEGFAMRGKDVLTSARVVPDVAAALAGCVRTFATSGKGGMYRRQAARDIRPGAREALHAAAHGPVAILFGPEDHGLTQTEILEVDGVIEIPAHDDYPVMNLAAAATVVCYELRQAHLEAHPAPASPYDDPLAGEERKRVLFVKLFDALEGVGFFRMQQNPDHLKYALRRVFGRAALTTTEADVLIGLCQQIRWYVDHTAPPAAWATRDAHDRAVKE